MTNTSEELKRLWKILNGRYGIYTIEQLRKEAKKCEIDIGIFTMPLKIKKEEVQE